MDPRTAAQEFLLNETQFRLGRLPTEQPHRATAGLAEALQRDPTAGIRQLQAVDRDLLPAASRVLSDLPFSRLVDSLLTALLARRRIIFTGCGATGRLAILLEACWREFWQTPEARRIAGAERLEECVLSVMAGGDYALIRSVEGFEDFTEFGRRQLRERGVGPGDVVVAITEGGETSFVIGTAWEGLDSGATVFFVFNNPVQVLCRTVERSREVMEESRITKLDLHTGPMAVAGSTRMQATTMEFLVLGLAMEEALGRLVREAAGTTLAGVCQAERARQALAILTRLLGQLEATETVAALAGAVDFEEGFYRDGGLVTYLAHRGMLDILTDTTERNPTFMLPPFRPADDHASPPSWAFAKNPLVDTPAAWREMLCREPRGLTWGAEVYRSLDAPARLRANAPALGYDQIMRFQIGREDLPSRHHASSSAAVTVVIGGEADRAEAGRTGDFLRTAATYAERFAQRAVVSISAIAASGHDHGASALFPILLPEAGSPIRLWERLAAKLVLNTISTATMGRMGRLVGNWMVHVDTSNKKLIDRGTRLVSELTGVGYERACRELFSTAASIDLSQSPGGPRPSAVAVTIERLLAEADPTRSQITGRSAEEGDV